MEIRETYVNETKGYRFGEADWYEPWTDNRSRLFLELQREYGRCISRMYRERSDGPDITVGWVFSKSMRYEDARGNDPDDFYVREVWIEIR